MLNNFIKSVFDGYAEATKDKRRKRAYEELEQTPFLFSSKYLNELHEEAETKDEYESILDHMYRHDATEVDSYYDIEKKIINRYWR